MTAQEKAKELVHWFYRVMPFKDGKLTSCGEAPALVETMELLSAKQCASKAVDEIIIATVIEIDRPDYTGKLYNKFWQQVKEEINKL